jgi:tetratricopeptide (TPR) repeat protein
MLCPKMTQVRLLSSELFEEGKVFLKKKNYDMARVKFQEALLKDPGNKKARKYLALCDQECVEIKKETVVKTEKSEAKKDDLEFIQALDSKIERLEKTPVPVTAAAEENSEADLKKVKKAERLIKQGNEYYSESKYEEAYQLYQEARQILRSSEYSPSNQI